MSVEEAAAERKREAAALRLRVRTGSAPSVRGDAERAGVMASGPLSQEELLARAAATAAAEAAEAAAAAAGRVAG